MANAGSHRSLPTQPAAAEYRGQRAGTLKSRPEVGSRPAVTMPKSRAEPIAGDTIKLRIRRLMEL